MLENGPGLTLWETYKPSSVEGKRVKLSIRYERCV